MPAGGDDFSSRGPVDAHPGASMLRASPPDAQTRTRNEKRERERKRERVLVSFWMAVFPLVADQAAGSPLALTGRERACPSAHRSSADHGPKPRPPRDGGVATMHGHADFPRVVEPR